MKLSNVLDKYNRQHWLDTIAELWCVGFGLGIYTLIIYATAGIISWLNIASV